MKQINLDAATRPAGVTPSALRREGQIPGVVYGKEFAPVLLSVETRALEKALQQGGRSQIVNLNVSGVGAFPVMVKELQQSPRKGNLTHVDFHKISLKDKLQAFVPVALVGEEAVEARGGIIQHQMRQIEVECLPTDIPSRITIDITNLNVGDHINISDVTFPANVVPVEDGDSMVLTIVAPKHAEEEVKPEEERTEPEVIGRKPEDKEKE